jgi:hypothetical protein
MKLNFYSDPGHGWLAVPLELLDRLNILDQISTYSYMRGGLAHLEEDCDYSRFALAMRDQGLEFSVREHRANNRSKIRSYCHFSPGVARVWIQEQKTARALA